MLESVLRRSGEEKNMNKGGLEIFEHDNDDDMDEDEDRKILNMSLIKNVLGPSGLNAMEDDDDDENPMKNQPSSNNRVTFSGVESVASKDDEEKDQAELVNKIGKLTAKLTQAEIDKSAEKAMRKKKEKSLVKLAKELNKRASDQGEKEKVINNLKGVNADLEARLHATRSEMDERILANEKKTKEYNEQLDEAHSKYRAIVVEHDAKQAELIKAHAAETEGLRRSGKEAELECERLRTQIAQVQELVDSKMVEITKLMEQHDQHAARAQEKFKTAEKEHEARVFELNQKHNEEMEGMRKSLLAANLECDKIRATLASIQMSASPEEADKIVKNTMRNASFINETQEPAPRHSSRMVSLASFGILLMALVVSYFTLSEAMNLCAPLPPGTMLSAAFEVTAEAPWWAPGSDRAYDVVCGRRPQTWLYWDGARLIIKDVDGKNLVNRPSTAVTVNGGSINFVDKKGKIESIRSPWAR